MRLDCADWKIEEVAQSSDPVLAAFYAMLDERDRWLLEHEHIDIHGDRRPISEDSK